MTQGVAVVGAFLLAVLLTPAVRNWSRRSGFFLGPRDRPSPDVPRCGGVALFISWAVLLLLTPERSVTGGLITLPPRPILLLATGLVFGVGLLDDHRPLPAWVKLAVEAGGALLLTAFGLEIDHVTISGHTVSLGAWGPVLTVWWFLLLTNAFNLVDGLDGLAAGLALIAGTTCAAIAVMRGDTATAAVLPYIDS